MKEFWIYAALRAGLFVGAFCIAFGAWFMIDENVNLLLVLVIAFLASGVASYIVLARQRNALAVKVEQHAGRMTEKYEEMRSKEDSSAD
ncbi:DUF4229 domain-containing protein [Pimelobacter simplex]|uniref:DUF4229 domain-containing protein n=1 Tax=Nocardioides simplex TaxID=2045 RepID=UPI00214F7926|nr:DUF4229 domain-containing protein [Pimelobacter simplex]UUW88740.1 DUF4229 domain-containing protein [Pimelobacter simplex]UUW98245.1 DUF4229 domain-containing protein [Pimelobacter simplex]